MSNWRPRVGIVGLGQMGQNHLRALSSLKGDAIIAGVADTDASRARIAEGIGVPFFPDYRELLPLVDAAVIAAPTPVHYPVVKDCLRAGVHVLVEKPLASTAEEATALAVLADESRLVLLVGHIERFNPVVPELVESIGGLGQLIGVHARRLSPFSPRGLDMDVASDLMLHDLDLVSWLIGRRVQYCHAAGLAVRSTLPDFATAVVAFEGGPVASFIASRVSQKKIRTLDITAEDGHVTVDFIDRKLVVAQKTVSRLTRGVFRQEGLVQTVAIPNAEPLQRELSHFLSCVRGEARPMVDGWAGVRVLELVEMIRGEMDSATTAGGISRGRKA